MGQKLKKLLEILCGTLAGAALFAIMVLTFFDVSGRKFLSQSITGSLELTELLICPLNPTDASDEYIRLNLVADPYF